ncbi:alpha/beta hydrolase [Nonlabens spongiae]|uniref:Alpha/beta hydrolase n=2 Tax=Nonlabens spongiae TaxID=331648 RepID=A0A1W6MP35_9FLAO|nr:alpha/beta hydrolase [Nonlabens spongiae]
MAASPMIYEHIKLPQDCFECHFLEWIIPDVDETLENYCRRFCKMIQDENPILIGTSFGGVIVQEMAKMMKVDRVVIISSIKSSLEFPRRMKLARSTGLHKLLPTSLVEKSELLLKYNLGISKRKLELYHNYLSVKNQYYLDWALDKIISWQQIEPIKNLIHIHGDKDPVFPIKYIKNCITVPGGTHVMIIHRYRWFNENLPGLLS